MVDVAIGQLHDDDELPFDDIDALDAEDERMVDFLDAVECLQLLSGRHFAVAVVEAALHELDGFGNAARRFGLPNVAETALAQWLDERVARDRLPACG